ncbi:MAG TPA: Eco57I restriction-modification methylase domain-containing protein [Spirochaetota bacterium]|nr:Eco57I restriction-modification methylase domain-containing protein [Spirochaetota bacterium]
MLTDSYNPDVLSCIANLSSDEVFTPPKLANEMLDLLPDEIWHDSTIKFLDPFTKTGVFLREITQRLMEGLKTKIPDVQERADHILKNQVYGIAITELTALLSRRTVYCSKKANGDYSVCSSFNDEQGNILYNKTEHGWENGRCAFCGASQSIYDRVPELETHAYQFIHTYKPEEIFNMKFDVIVGNPPYQMTDGGGTGSSARPIYNYFVEKALELNPSFLCMIIPSRWFSSGKGLDCFRNKMLNDKRVKYLIDYSDSRDCFPSVDIAGGVCYFLWEKDYHGKCTVINFNKGTSTKTIRPLNEFDIFIRDGIAVSIIHKIREKSREYLDSIVSSRKPFGLESKDRPTKNGDLTLIWSGGDGPFPREKVKSGHNYIDKYKVLLSKASFDHGGQPDKDGKRRIFSRVETMAPGTICTESYILVGPFATKTEADLMVKYLKLKLPRFLVSTILLTQNIAKDKFAFVPLIDISQKTKDKDLYNMFGLTHKEIDYIESTIRPME